MSSSDTAWMLASAALVLFMTPGLALFYGGLVRSKNVLSTMMHSFAAMAVIPIVWFLWGYTLAFGGDIGSVIGNLDHLFMKGVAWDSPHPDLAIPQLLFATYQGMFAIITPALIAGAFAERMKFSAYLLFIVLWSTLVYSPVCHWVWGGGWLGGMKVLDFAGGTVVHISSGVAALAAALIIGKREGYPKTPMMPHNLPWCVLGAGILWFGWFGFNGGSALASDGVAVLAFTTTHLAAATAAFTWLAVEWFFRGKPTMLGVATGAVAGLVGITPAAGFVSPGSAILLGAITSCVCYWFVSKKESFGYDDSLDAFGVHGVGGTVGAILTGVFAMELADGMSRGKLIGLQALGAGVTIVYSFVVSLILLKILDAWIGLRVDPDTEVSGLDVNIHGESGYTL
ncbi:MAG: ammonium transporter [Candidatus Omnitrophica bacterium]|nr:ammonium transporter [Candidatus Omnitrophota bacterium]